MLVCECVANIIERVLLLLSIIYINFFNFIFGDINTPDYIQSRT